MPPFKRITCLDCGQDVPHWTEFCPTCGRRLNYRRGLVELLVILVTGLVMSELFTKMFVQQIGD